ncbi:MAG TPA: TSUP family transporter [Gaiellaceae bacterium]|nr:TSUP family transporter [Gaiellaceae bacterium]
MSTLGLLVLLIAFGAAAGVLAGLLGVGGGILLVPFLVLVVGMTQHEAEATSLLVILPTAIAASVALRRRNVGDLPTALAVGLVGAVGAVAGVLLALALDADVLRLVFAVLLAFVGVRLIGDARAVR